MKCNGKQNLAGAQWQMSWEYGEISCQDPIPPGPPSAYPEKSIKWTGLDGSHRTAVGDPCKGWGSSFYKQDLRLNRALRRVSEDIGEALKVF